MANIKICPDCHGTGAVPYEREGEKEFEMGVCTTCCGEGHVEPDDEEEFDEEELMADNPYRKDYDDL